MAPFRIARPRFLAFFLLELGLVVGVVWGLAALTISWSPTVDAADAPAAIGAVAGLLGLVLLATQWSNLSYDGSLVREIAVFGLLSLFLAGLYVAAAWIVPFENHRLSLLLALEGAVAVPLAVALWRACSTRLNVFSGVRESVLILGTGETAQQVCRWIVEHHASEYAVVGFASERGGREGQILTMGVRVQSDFEGLPNFAASRVDRIIVGLDEMRGRLPLHQLMELRLQGVEIEGATSFFERTSGKIAVETMLPSWLIFSDGFKATRWRALLKRSADVLLALLLLLPALPLMALTALAIRLDSRGPALYRQARLGRDRLEFEVLKFRSMRVDAEAESGPAWTKKHDPRITRVGALIRKTRIDELPQLINVLRGEMSFVGPRPERRHFVEQLEQTIPYYGLRMIVRPGITGWAQVMYGYGDSEQDALEKLKYDLYYIKNHNLLLDLWIVCKTVGVVLFGKGR